MNLARDRQNTAPRSSDKYMKYIPSRVPVDVKLHDPEDVHEKAPVRHERQSAEDDDHDVVADSVGRRAIVLKAVPRVSFPRLWIDSIGRGRVEGEGGFGLI